MDQVQIKNAELWPEALECITHLINNGYVVKDVTVTSTSSIDEKSAKYYTKSMMFSFDDVLVEPCDFDDSNFKLEIEP